MTCAATVSYTHLDVYKRQVEYELQAAEGNLDVTRNYYHYEDEMMRKKTEEHFTADSWSYTEDGYLMFSGTGALDEMYVMTLSLSLIHI